MTDAPEQEQPHDQLKAIQTALGSGMFVHVRRMLHQMEPEDVAFLLESSPPKGRTVLWQLVDPDQQGEILESLSEEVKDPIIHLMDPEHVAIATEGMDTDELAYILRGLPDTVYEGILASMDARDRHRVQEALSYPEGTAASLMSTDTVTLRPDVNVDVVLRYLRLRGELPEATDELYVVNKEDKLVGAISLARLLTVDPNRTVAEVMDHEDEQIPFDMDTSDVAKLFERRDWISAPVVDAEARLLGRLTIDDMVDVIREEAEHTMMGMAGMDDEEDTFGPVMKSARRRSIWLGINLLTALLAAMVSNMFEDTLDKIATLAVLMTIVPSMGGIAGNQTLALVIRGAALGHISEANSRWLLGKETLIGLLNGLMWAILIAAVVALWKQDLALGAIIAFAMFVNMLVAGLSGVAIPLLMKRMKIDPALAGSVVLTTLTDVIGLFAFLGMASLFF